MLLALSHTKRCTHQIERTGFFCNKPKQFQKFCQFICPRWMSGRSFVCTSGLLPEHRSKHRIMPETPVPVSGHRFFPFTYPAPGRDTDASLSRPCARATRTRRDDEKVRQGCSKSNDVFYFEMKVVNIPDRVLWFRKLFYSGNAFISLKFWVNGIDECINSFTQINAMEIECVPGVSYSFTLL